MQVRQVRGGERWSTRQVLLTGSAAVLALWADPASCLRPGAVRTPLQIRDARLTPWKRPNWNLKTTGLVFGHILFQSGRRSGRPVSPGGTVEPFQDSLSSLLLRRLRMVFPCAVASEVVLLTLDVACRLRGCGRACGGSFRLKYIQRLGNA